MPQPINVSHLVDTVIAPIGPKPLVARFQHVQVAAGATHGLVVLAAEVTHWGNLNPRVAADLRQVRRLLFVRGTAPASSPSAPAPPQLEALTATPAAAAAAPGAKAASTTSDARGDNA